MYMCMCVHIYICIRNKRKHTHTLDPNIQKSQIDCVSPVVQYGARNALAVEYGPCAQWVVIT